MHFDAYAKMHQNASVCTKMHQNASNVCGMNCANFLCINLSKKWFLLHLIRIKCIKMHQTVCRMNYSNVLRVKFQFEKINFFWLKMTNFFLSAQNASICIMMHQNVCRMNCANVLCMKLSKKWFWLHLKEPKLTKYICHFMVVHPVYLYRSK